MPDYDREIRDIVISCDLSSALLLRISCEYKNVFDALVNEAARICDNADNNERQRYGQQSWVLSSSFGHPGQLLIRPMAMLVRMAMTELHWSTSTAASEASRKAVENLLIDAGLVHEESP